MKLALFDLDNTLLPMDSDHGWSQFLIDQGLLDREEFEAKNNYFYEQYKAGTLNILEYCDFNLRVLKNNPRPTLLEWRANYMQKVIQPQVLPVALQLVKQHQDAGALCLIITATNTFVTRPIADAFGVEHLIGTEPEEHQGQFTGRVSGEPSFREGKIRRLNAWLNHRGQKLEDFESVHFYSDSVNDLPLLECATHPVATNPDDTLRGIAQSRNWAILELFA